MSCNNIGRIGTIDTRCVTIFQFITGCIGSYELVAPVQFLWTGLVDQFIKKELMLIWLRDSFFIQLTPVFFYMNCPPSLVPANWTGCTSSVLLNWDATVTYLIDTSVNRDVLYFLQTHTYIEIHHNCFSPSYTLFTICWNHFLKYAIRTINPSQKIRFELLLIYNLNCKVR